MKPLLPRDWRRRREVPPRSARFVIYGERGSWDLVDEAYAKVIGFDRKSEAEDAAWFARQYVKRHGDIDFGSFPYTLDQELHYEDVEETIAFWEEEYA